MVCCLTAKHLGAKYTIARVHNLEYAAELAELKQELGIDLVINPENATAEEIARLLRFPSADHLDTFCRGRVEMIGFRVRESHFFCGHPLSELSRQVKELPILFCAAERGDKVLIPDGSFVPQTDDKLYLTYCGGSALRHFVLALLHPLAGRYGGAHSHHRPHALAG